MIIETIQFSEILNEHYFILTIFFCLLSTKLIKWNFILLSNLMLQHRSFDSKLCYFIDLQHFKFIFLKKWILENIKLHILYVLFVKEKCFWWKCEKKILHKIEILTMFTKVVSKTKRLIILYNQIFFVAKNFDFN